MTQRISKKRLDKGLWWERTLRLTAGCTKVSPACDHCWAETEANIRMKQSNEKIAEQYLGSFDGSDVRFLPENLNKLHRATKPKVWAVWNDLFHHDICDYLVRRAMYSMTAKNEHEFIICTKRATRAALFSRIYEFYYRNLFYMTTVEDQARVPRAEDLAEVPTLRRNRALSVEPLLGAVEFDYSILAMFGTVIIGCESGPKRRPCDIEWVRRLASQCDAVNTKVFVKQLSIGGKVIKDINLFPRDLQRRELCWGGLR